ncbi:hypothetical protein DAPPUDRAFT_327683 [Daphnia pulex]|uniref:Retroviral polymerase SH3-like domain-containing protein n=1 Tax=Daphnia pulex TaxID=6669 RepID=E9HBE6_DAPPU|nr:hypothetical protein DAPPUDRAFT_327683 [Daphnia pulex]|eukprot:EFX70958.1 hypothetical protein DAPPUDRAFT_327683 [Daphnia pulex]
MAGVNGDNEVPEEETTTPPTQKDLRDATTWKKQRSAVRQQITKTIRYLGNLVNERGSRGSISSLMKHLENLLATAAKIHTNLSTVEDQAENDRQDEFHLKYVELAGDALERGQQYLNSRLGEPPSVIAGKKAPSISPSEQNRQEEERQLAQQRADAAILQADEARRQANEAANRADQARREATAAQQALQNLENDDDDTSAVTNLSQHLSQLGKDWRQNQRRLNSSTSSAAPDDVETNTQNAFRVYIPSTKKILISKDVKVDETMFYNDMKKQSKEPQTDEPVFQELDLDEAPTDINIPQEISRPLEDEIQDGTKINNEAIDEEIVQDTSPNAINTSSCVDRQVNNERTRQSARRPKFSERYLQYRQSIAKQAIIFGLPSTTSNSSTKSRPIEPSSYLEAISCADSELWIPAIIEENRKQ